MRQKIIHIKQIVADLLEFVNHLPYINVWEEAVNQLRSHGSEGERHRYEIMPYTPQHIANFFLDRADSEGQPMTQLRLLKLVYIAYGWYLALTDDRLFEEPIEAWKHGPVVESLYHEFKHCRSNPITERSTQIDLDTWEEITPRIPRSDTTAILILEKVWASYRKFRAWDLRNKTHEKDGPWHRVYDENLQHTPLNDDDIREHYKQRIAAYINAAKKETEPAI